jgi:signal transduction histidine kinase
MSVRRLGLRARLTLGAVAAAAIALAVLIAAFNIVLDARLRDDADDVLRERAATVLRGLGTVNGRLSVVEAPDVGAVDAQTWIFARGRALERPAQLDPRNRVAADTLARAGGGFTTVAGTDTRLLAAPVRSASRRLGTVVVGASVSPYESTASSALLGSSILGVVMLAATVALSRWLLGRALRPVAEMTERASAWGDRDLGRRFFAGDPHDELTALAAVLDRLLARIAESLRREQRLTAEVSHELRTPLAKIAAEAELGRGRQSPPGEQAETLERIGEHARELQEVLDTLLASARSGQLGAREGSDPAESATRAGAQAQDALAAQGKAIVVTCHDARARTAVEDEVVQRILAPLLDNAGRFASSRVELAVRAISGFVVFEVSDDGPGVAPPNRELIFEPGFRSRGVAGAGAADGEQGHAGAGLGLSLVRRLTRAAGGEVEALERSSGASFVVRLPAHSGAALGARSFGQQARSAAQTQRDRA